MSTQLALSRRKFLATSALFILAPQIKGGEPAEKPEAIIDIHQHTSYSGRSHEQLLAHQRAMGVTKTVLLPAGRIYGLEAGCGGNETVVALAKEHSGEFAFFANEVPDYPEARAEIETYLKLGAIGIGEQKFRLDCDSKPIEMVAELARQYQVPVLLHFQHGTYNTSFERFHRILEKFPQTNFIGHAQTWWGNIDKDHDQKIHYPKGKVTAGGITDRLLSDYPNMYGDLSAGSGLNALLRDEEHTRGFLERHQDKLLYGSDCSDPVGRGPDCQGFQTIATVRRLSSSKIIERKLLYENAKRLLRL